MQIKYDAKLLFTDADSLVDEIKTKYVYEDFYEDKNLLDFGDFTRFKVFWSCQQKSYWQNERWIQRKND